MDPTAFITFFTDRLDEDERIARPARPGPTPGPWRYSLGKQWHAPEDLADHVNGEEFVAAGPRETPICVASTGPAADPQSIADALHIARHHPTRVLAEVGAKRQILAPYAAAVAAREQLRKEMRKIAGEATDQFMKMHREESELIETETRLRPIVRALATVYAEHPDYDEAWRP